jgi:uncharacterized damage-inducible protein DinB
MATKMETNHIAVPRGRYREATSFLTQMDDQSRRMLVDLRGASATELQWQPKRGMNTIGMLLAHIAIVEVFWLQVGMERASEAALEKVTKLGGDDDGMPLPPAGAPPAVLRGRTLAWYTKLLARSRSWSRRSLRAWPDAAMDRFVVRTRRNGTQSRVSRRWILYHVLEHQAGHYGQILLLRHQFRDRNQGK